jgi:hypothetical protein
VMPLIMAASPVITKPDALRQNKLFQGDRTGP